MKTRYFILLLLTLFAVTPVWAGERVTDGEINLGYRFSDYDQGDSAYFEEYGDFDDGVIGSFRLFTAKDRLYLNATADTAGVQVKSGIFNKARFSLFYDEFDHNYSFNNLTPHTGIGSDNLPLIPGYGAGTANWRSLDYSVERKHYGAGLDLTLAAPYFFSVTVERIDKDGKIPYGANSVNELPMPIDYQTTNTSTQGSYRTKTLLLQIDGSYSKFNNDNNELNFERYDYAAQTPIILPPDNTMKKIGGQVVLRELPLNSTFALRGNYSKLESDVTLLTDESWDGEVSYTTAAMILRSRPMNNLDTELSYRYVDRDNDSDEVAELFHYTKHNVALEAAYRLTPDNRIAAGYDYLTADRAKEARPDAEENTDHTIFLEWKNSTLDYLTSKIRYEYLTRDTDSNSSATIIVSNPYDYAEKDQDKWIVALELMPMEGLDMGLEYNYRNADYDDSDFGVSETTSHELIIDASISLPAKSNLYTYAAYEKTQDEYTARPSDPYDVELTDKGWSYGAKVTVPLLEDRLKLSASWDYQKNDGKADFSSGTTTFVDIKDYDDYTLKTLKLKAEYAIRENLAVVLSYLYEKYDYSDLKMEDYEYQIDGDTRYILTGAYSDPEYDVNAGYVSLKYTF